jgi:hypothetical protein
MSWFLLQRLLNGFFTFLGGVTAIIVTTQNTGLSQTHLVWMGIVCAVSSTTVAILPSLFGISGVEPKREATVLREQESAGVLRGLQVAKTMPPEGMR